MDIYLQSFDIIKKTENNEELWYLYYPNSGSCRTIGHSPLSEATEVLDPSGVIIGNPNGRYSLDFPRYS